MGGEGVTWPWKRRGSLADLEARIGALEESTKALQEQVPRLLTLMEMQGAATEKHHELQALETELQVLQGSLPADRGDQPYHW